MNTTMSAIEDNIEPLYSRDKVHHYLQYRGYNKTSVVIGGCQRWDKTGYECIFVNGSNNVAQSIIYYLLKKTGDELDLFLKIIEN